MRSDRDDAQAERSAVFFIRIGKAAFLITQLNTTP